MVWNLLIYSLIHITLKPLKKILMWLFHQIIGKHYSAESEYFYL